MQSATAPAVSARYRVCNVEHTLQDVEHSPSVSSAGTAASDDDMMPSAEEVFLQMLAYIREYEFEAQTVCRRRDLLIQLFRYFEKYFVALCSPFTGTTTAGQRQLLYQLLHFMQQHALQVKHRCEYIMEVYGMHIDHTILLCDIVITSAPPNESLQALLAYYQYHSNMLSASVDNPPPQKVGGPNETDQFAMSLGKLGELVEQLLQQENVRPRAFTPSSTPSLSLYASSSDSTPASNASTTSTLEVDMDGNVDGDEDGDCCSLSGKSSFRSIDTNFSFTLSSEYGEIEEYELELISI